jgi:hypothetical protein
VPVAGGRRDWKASKTAAQGAVPAVLSVLDYSLPPSMKEEIMQTVTISRVEAACRAKARLDAPRADGERWSTDFHPGGRSELVRYLAYTGCAGEYGRNFEELADPLAVHIPGAAERSTRALLDAVADTGLTVATEHRPGMRPRFALGGRHATAGLMDVRGVVLALLVEYRKPGAATPAELLYAAERLSLSGTHANSVTYMFAAERKRGTDE